jgi:quercetin dioxygenase-like cupin family protein
MATDFSLVRLEDVEQERFPELGNRHRKLTEPLGCTEMRVNTVTLGPGEATTPHAHERQEELYIALDGGHLDVDEIRHEVPEGGVVRLGPDVVRSVRNESQNEEQTWIMCGAPPVGTIDDFGEYTVPADDD